MKNTEKPSYSDNLERRVQSNQYRIGLVLLWVFGAYLGLMGLQLTIIERNFISGIPLVLTALLILPPPAGIAGFLRERFGITTGQRIGMSIILLFIAWLTLSYL